MKCVSVALTRHVSTITAMATNRTPDEIRQRVIAQGRAMVRLIESIDVLLTNSGSWRESLLLRVTRGVYRHRLRRLIGVLPADISAEILAASDSIGGGPVQDPSRN